ncbi:putative mitochondrial protein, conserved [Mortierella polycephala]|uniref:Succinate dehydrogenase assembly factor 4, mitochondrial n=1 Tax=Mortierella polycephala TaxID=41804 RepID=A0A9P6PSV5_9FUNG|nr:putative mitochondrial protein, conserved [Mortierella polycephala]
MTHGSAMASTIRNILSANIHAVRETVTGAPAAVVFHRTYSSKGLRSQGPRPILLESAKDQAEFEQLVKKAASSPATSHPDAKAPVPEEFEGDTNPTTGEVGGPKREPVRFGDWSFKGRVTDF